MTRPMQTVSLYMLTDPCGRPTCYVGITRDPKNRYKSHCNRTSIDPADMLADWISGLRMAGLKPVMTILDIVDRRYATQAEGDAIAMVTAVRGKACLNITQNPLYPAGRYNDIETKAPPRNGYKRQGKEPVDLSSFFERYFT